MSKSVCDAMQTAFASAMQQARESCGHDIANWRAILSALLRVVTVQDPQFEETVVLFAKRRQSQEPLGVPLERVFERAAVYFLSSIDPGLPDAWGFARAPRQDDAQDPPPLSSFASPPPAPPPAKAALSVSAYSGIKVKNLLTLFPDHKLQFRPLDSFKLDLVTAVTFISIAINKFGGEEAFSDLIALASATVWFVGVTYRIQARSCFPPRGTCVCGGRFVSSVSG